uniref:Uncharacterized protein n=1 Tax=Timspurckia oligopyrenoides TaxID=708627 RepID=A0A7S0ZG24_9RHOD
MKLGVQPVGFFTLHETAQVNLRNLSILETYDNFTDAYSLNTSPTISLSSPSSLRYMPWISIIDGFEISESVTSQGTETWEFMHPRFKRILEKVVILPTSIKTNVRSNVLKKSCNQNSFKQQKKKLINGESRSREYNIRSTRMLFKILKYKRTTLLTSLQC